MENIVFLELKRRGYDVYVGALDELFSNADYNGIKKLNVLNWLLNI